jgi:hypothetical protein
MRARKEEELVVAARPHAPCPRSVSQGQSWRLAPLAWFCKPTDGISLASRFWWEQISRTIWPVPARDAQIVLGCYKIELEKAWRIGAPPAPI